VRKEQFNVADDIPECERTKRRNIVEMALDFTGMMRLFTKGTNSRIEAKLTELFSSLPEITTRESYEAYHHGFCEWFTQEIQTAEKHLKNGRFLKCEAASYGHAAKVLDIAIKVYVYYCGQPTAEVAERLIPFLNGAVDTPIMNYLKKSKRANAIHASTLKDVDQSTYRALQSLVLFESQSREVHPVQYDDIMWRQLNRDA
jgi:hypothetical protein